MTLRAGLAYASWVKSGRKCYAVWLPTRFGADKAGKCSPSSLP
jgi:hypothetical protein